MAGNGNNGKIDLDWRNDVTSADLDEDRAQAFDILMAAEQQFREAMEKGGRTVRISYKKLGNGKFDFAYVPQAKAKETFKEWEAKQLAAGRRV